MNTVRTYEALIHVMENGYQLDITGPVSPLERGVAPSHQLVFLTSYTLSQWLDNFLPKPSGVHASGEAVEEQ